MFLRALRSGSPEGRGGAEGEGAQRVAVQRGGGPNPKKVGGRRVGTHNFALFSLSRPTFRNVLLSLGSSRGIVVPVQDHEPLKVCVWAPEGTVGGKRGKNLGGPAEWGPGEGGPGERGAGTHKNTQTHTNTHTHN